MLYGNDYSVHTTEICRRVEVHADQQRVQVRSDARLVADHDRIWARHQTISADKHVTAAKALRAARIGLLRPPPPAEVEIRRLSDYDAALGLTDGGVA
jgi:hypothetical protein